MVSYKHFLTYVGFFILIVKVCSSGKETCQKGNGCYVNVIRLKNNPGDICE